MTAVKVQNTWLCSCYISPNGVIKKFTRYIDKLVPFIGLLGKDIIIEGDFNAKSLDWESREDNRGQIPAEWVAQGNMLILNTHSVPTFGEATPHLYLI